MGEKDGLNGALSRGLKEVVCQLNPSGPVWGCSAPQGTPHQKGVGSQPEELSFFLERHAPLQVKVCNSALLLHMRGKSKSVTVEKRPGQANADFRKTRDGFVLLLPSH
ncbi:hypothetical protein SKAU_G00405390 [Synaphobranchus kaupii]|uniref:Uncharacterized protein n=1 Tax=Synaphobranchus kaupii TaxID=118154 RepID=A0A9Q1E9T8_SYNKA|nr:hypothetical protein SKAU_G00405390 [Synaphobranchus kaupii]